MSICNRPSCAGSDDRHTPGATCRWSTVMLALPIARALAAAFEDPLDDAEKRVCCLVLLHVHSGAQEEAE